MHTKAKVRQLQIALYLAAKANPKRRFHALYDKMYREDVMRIAWTRAKANGGSAGIDQETIDYIVREYGEERLIEECRQALMNKTYRPKPVRRHEIPKGDGRTRPLGIPTLRDRVTQMAAKIVAEPVFEADFHYRRMYLWWNKKHKRRKASRVKFNELLKFAGLKTVSTWG
jgi:retron-type reverse transcriptase